MSTLSLDIRQATPVDAGAISQAHDASWRHAYNGIVPYRALQRMLARRNEAWWHNALSRSTHILIARFGDEVAGYATIGKNRVATLPFAGEVYELYLRPEFQGIGLGKGLFLDARKALARRNLMSSVVWVLADNEPAIGFYENAGGRLVAQGEEVFDGKKLCKLAYAWD